MERFGKEPAKHLFDVEVRKYDVTQGQYVKKCVEVLADTRSQAGSIMKKQGFEVCSVNMVD